MTVVSVWVSALGTTTYSWCICHLAIKLYCSESHTVVAYLRTGPTKVRDVKMDIGVSDVSLLGRGRTLTDKALSDLVSTFWVTATCRAIFINMQALCSQIRGVIRKIQ